MPPFGSGTWQSNVAYTAMRSASVEKKCACDYDDMNGLMQDQNIERTNSVWKGLESDNRLQLFRRRRRETNMLDFMDGGVVSIQDSG